MRRALALVPLLLVAATLPVANGQEDAPLLDDAKGDVHAASPQGDESPLPAGERPAIDLLSLSGVEAPDAFRFTLTVSSLVDPLGDPERGNQYRFGFTHSDTEFQVRITQRNLAGADLVARLWQFDPGLGQYNVMHDVDLTTDLAAGTLTVDLPRDSLRDTQGASPHPGRQLEAFYALATSGDVLPPIDVEGQEVEGAYLIDRMPDEGVGEAVLPVLFGVTQEGHIHLRSQEPFRYSNGEASTFVFRVQAINGLETEDAVRLSFKEVPPNWDVRAPSSTLRIPGNNFEEPLEIPIVVRTVFAHDHGNTDSLIVEAESLTAEGAVGRIQIGIHYPLIPQPAGHHDTLWFHSRPDTEDPLAGTVRDAVGTATGTETNAVAYVNAHEDSDGELGDADLNVPGQRCGDDPTVTAYCWDVDLAPSLKMGLDFDLERIATLDVPISTTLPLTGATLEGGLWLQEPIDFGALPGGGPGGGIGRGLPREERLLLAFQPSDPQDISALEQVNLVASGSPEPDADLIEYDPGNGITLRLRLTAQQPQAPLGPEVRPEITPGGTVTFPLFEYEDPVAEIFGQTGAVQLVAEEQERFVNPGETVVYRVSLRNDGGLEDAFRMDFSGSNDAWAQLITPKSVSLAAGKKAEMQLAVTAPDGAPDGDRADLVLEAQSATDPSIRALVRLLTTVDTDEDHEDESELAGILRDEQGRESPGVAGVLGLTLLVAMAALRRRIGAQRP